MHVSLVFVLTVSEKFSVFFPNRRYVVLALPKRGKTPATGSRC